jgi:hypothetical protein
MDEKKLKAWRLALRITGPLVILIIWILSVNLASTLFHLIAYPLLFLFYSIIQGFMQNPMNIVYRLWSKPLGNFLRVKRLPLPRRELLYFNFS